MPPKHETHTQKAAQYQLKAAQLQTKAKFEELKAKLLQHPELAQMVLDYLQTISSKENLQSPRCIVTPKKKNELQDELAGDGDDRSSNPSAGASASGHNSESHDESKGSEETENKITNMIPAMYNTIDNLSVKFLKAILFRLEPIAFSPFALKALVQRGQREISKVAITQIIEFTTGVQATVPIIGN